jgi:hypothetical protein
VTWEQQGGEEGQRQGGAVDPRSRAARKGQMRRRQPSSPRRSLMGDGCVYLLERRRFAQQL